MLGFCHELMLDLLLAAVFTGEPPAKNRLRELVLADVRSRARAAGASQQQPWGRLRSQRREFAAAVNAAAAESSYSPTLLRTMLITGHETTAVALAWTIERLARHPEQADVVRRSSRASAARNVVLEALRVRPVIPVVHRTLQSDLVGGGGRTLPSGTRVGISAWGAHHDERRYLDPSSFRPDRFETVPAPRSTDWLPFGGGNRRCLGAHMALEMASKGLCALLERFEVTAPDPRGEPAVPASIMLVPGRRVQVMLRPARV